MTPKDKPKGQNLLTSAAYARHRAAHDLPGTTRPAVSQALRTGRISYEANSSLIDPVKADADWLANTELNALGASQDSDYLRSRAKREFHEAEISQIKAQTLRGKLIDVDTVRKVLFAAGRAFRAALEDVTNQLSPDLAAESDIGRTERILKTRFDRLLNEMTARIEKQDESLFAASAPPD